MPCPASKSRQSGSPKPGMVTTTVFIANLHCPSCINSIRSCVSELSPQPEFVSHSIISHSITLCHDASLTSKAICDALESEGFEVHSTFQDGPDAAGPSNPTERRYAGTSEWKSSLEQAVSKWEQSFSHTREFDMAKRQQHVENCEQCQRNVGGKQEGKVKDETADVESLLSSKELQAGGIKSWESGDSSQSLGGDLEGVAVHSAGPQEVFKATLAISGMTCSACVGSITHAVENLSFIEAVNVNLITHSATVVFTDKNRAAEIVETIEDAGFDASVEQIEALSPPVKGTAATPEAERWRATFAVGGMTCSACVGNVTNTLEKFDFIDHVDVNLLSNSAVVEFRDKKKVAEIQDAIEDAGYDATLDSIIELKPQAEQITHRVVSLKVGGLHCRNCPYRISEALMTNYGDRIEIQKQLTESDPILSIKYLPDAPRLTLRQIINTIGETDPTFTISVYHPPTIEERARDMHRLERRRILFRLALSVSIAIPTFIVGIVFMDLVPSENPIRVYIEEPMWAGSVSRAQWALLILATPVYFLAADVFHVRALKEIRSMWRPGSKTPIRHRFFRFGSMNMLMSLGTSIAYFASIAELIIAALGKEMVSDADFYFDSVVFLTMFILTGRFLEAYSKARTGDAVTSLGKLRPAEAVLVDQGGTDLRVPTDHLEINDVVRVQHGSSPPFDGSVLEGSATFDESSLTGESRPIKKEPGDSVFAGTINKGSPITVKITSISGTSMLDQIIKVVREGQTRRAPLERAADVITSHFVPLVTVIAISTWIIWLSLGLSGVLPSDYRDPNSGDWPLWSLRFAIAVFVVACPCGIGLAAPTALFVGGGLAAQHGILVKGGGEAFQEASQLDCIVFDKTGTLTQGGDPQVTDFIILPGPSQEWIVGMALKLEESSSHPIAKAIVSFCSSKERKAADVVDVSEIPGKGLRGDFKLYNPSTGASNVSIIIGNESLMHDHQVSPPPQAAESLHRWKIQGKSVALMAIKRSDESTFELVACFSISDPLRVEAASTVTALRSRGLDVWLLSGDNPITAQAVGKQLNIPETNIIAGVLPDQKAEKIKYLQRTLTARPARRSVFTRLLFPFRKPTQRRALIAMVGDGINDAPALSHADVSIAIGTGSAVALASSSFILVSSSLTSVLTLIDLSRAVFRRVWFNFGWALVYNMIGMPIAAGVLYPLRPNGGPHVRLDPVWASLAMALSSVSVVCSSLLLKTALPGAGFRAAKY